MDNAVAQFDTRFTLRALRSISSLRKKLTREALTQTIVSTYPATAPSAKTFLQVLYDGDEDEFRKAAGSLRPTQAKQEKEVLSEVDVYLGIAIQVSRQRNKA